MSKIQILLLIVLVFSITYGVVNHSQTRKYFPDQVIQIVDKMNIGQLKFSHPNYDQLSSHLSLGSLPQNKFTSWLKTKVTQLTEDTASSAENKVASDEQSSHISSEDSSSNAPTNTNAQSSIEEDEEGADNLSSAEPAGEESSYATKQIKTLTSRAAEIGEETKKVLGASIQPVEHEAEGEKPIYQSVIESGMYYYCKQVVEDYETNHPPKEQ